MLYKEMANLVITGIKRPYKRAILFTDRQHENKLQRLITNTWRHFSISPRSPNVPLEVEIEL